jgi:serine O-acetyltransferase
MGPERIADNEDSMSNSDFRLFAYLAADLRRQRAILSRPEDQAPTWRLWLGVVSPRFAPVLLARLAHWAYLHRLGPVAKVFSLVNVVVFGIEIAVRCPIGKGLYLPHTHGTVIGARGVGANATIFQGVTLGAREVDLHYRAERRPLLGDDVLVGAGAKILGGLVVGDGARIGANAVVIESVPPGATAVGVPARLMSSVGSAGTVAGEDPSHT